MAELPGVKGLPAKILRVSCGWMSYGCWDNDLKCSESLFRWERQERGPRAVTPNRTFLDAFVSFSWFDSAMATFSHKHWITHHTRTRELGENLEIGRKR